MSSQRGPRAKRPSSCNLRPAPIAVNSLKFCSLPLPVPCQMNTRFHCIAPAPNIAKCRASSASWRGPACSLDRGGAFCSSRYRSMSEPPISTARRRGVPGRDRRDARVDAVGAGRAFAIRGVAAGAQTLTIWPAIEGWPRSSRASRSAVYLTRLAGSCRSSSTL